MAETKRPRTKTPAQEFKSFLLKKKISPAQLEERIGIARMTTWRWCNGKVKPSGMARKLLSERLGFKWKGE
jgi:DNA-binding transcriptional regulator YiaG